MPQSLTQLPETADLQIDEWPICIRDHKVLDDDGLFGEIMGIVNSLYVDRNELKQLEEHGISFEAAIECCAGELGGNEKIHGWRLLRFINWHPEDMEECHTSYRIMDKYGDALTLNFSNSTAGRRIADEIVEEIRQCENWGELYDKLHMTSRFQKDINNKIRRKMEQCLKV